MSKEDNEGSQAFSRGSFPSEALAGDVNEELALPNGPSISKGPFGSASS